MLMIVPAYCRSMKQGVFRDDWKHRLHAPGVGIFFVNMAGTI
jgi:hypothetical protein